MPQSGVTSITFSPNNNLLFSAIKDGTIIIWDASNLQSPVKLSSFLAHNNVINSIAVSPDGNLLASASRDQTITLWNITDPKNPARTNITFDLQRENTRGNISKVVFSPNGQLLASASYTDHDRIIMLWDIKGKLISRILSGHDGDITDISFAPSITKLASGSLDKTIILWNIKEPKSPQVLSTLYGHTSKITGIAISSDDQLLISSSGDKLIVWQLSNPQTTLQIGLPLSFDGWMSTTSFFESKTLAAVGSSPYIGYSRLVIWNFDSDFWKVRACQIAGRNLTREEWARFVGNINYRKTCEQFPEGE
jgi:WD40 repeat protein